MAIALDYCHGKGGFGWLRSELCRDFICGHREYLLDCDGLFSSVDNCFDFCFKAHQLPIPHGRDAVCCVSVLQHTTARNGQLLPIVITSGSLADATLKISV